MQFVQNYCTMEKNNQFIDGVYCHIIQMRGLPFRASEEEIRSFFSPISVSAVQFEFGFDSRPTGRASVAFPTHKDAEKAMERDKNTIGRFVTRKNVPIIPFSSRGLHEKKKILN